MPAFQTMLLGTLAISPGAPGKRALRYFHALLGEISFTVELIRALGMPRSIRELKPKSPNLLGNI